MKSVDSLRPTAKHLIGSVVHCQPTEACGGGLIQTGDKDRPRVANDPCFAVVDWLVAEANLSFEGVAFARFETQE
ncbi:hypothetical protein CEE69_22960 [Rhodopirellula bahusiensis]|uniref:Uncharacterized protein n=1 Tax=Rhodopirellula bahusiensis TaxID=2014065 RepID=A0A2G1W1G4_9BACT|nr:hypothetical protein CEE69_22960 [Rhodopirellula bahusiensis]